MTDSIYIFQYERCKNILFILKLWRKKLDCGWVSVIHGKPAVRLTSSCLSTCLSCRTVVDGVAAPSGSQSQVTHPSFTHSHYSHELQIPAAHVCVSSPQRGGGVERMRREAQLAALRYDEERQRNRSLQRDSASSYSKVPPVHPLTPAHCHSTSHLSLVH